MLPSREDVKSAAVAVIHWKTKFKIIRTLGDNRSWKLSRQQTAAKK
jgi:hypothetical protein